MSAVLSDPVLASPDERIAALLLQRGKLKDADWSARAGYRKTPAVGCWPCWRGSA